MTQPKWKTIQATDYSRIQVDETGVYAPEMEVAQDCENGTFEVFRFSLDRLKRDEESGFLIPFGWDESWPYGASVYREWFDRDLARVADSIGSKVADLRTALCSDGTNDRAWAYEAIGGYHGFVNLDSDPLTLTESELDARWEK